MIKTCKVIYFFLSVLFSICVTIQFLFAGMAIFMDPGFWTNHVLFIHIFGFSLPLLMLIFAIFGKMPKWIFYELVIIFVFIFGMYFTANGGRLLSWIGAIHPLVGLCLLAISIVNVYHSFQLIKRNNGGMKHGK